jgi:UDP-N-acetylmuramate dehydrogenase
MTTVSENVSLLPYNTFKIDASARYFVIVKTVDEALEVFKSELFKQNKSLILGGGSNLLLTKNFEGIVIKNELMGIQKVNEDDDKVVIKVGAGENWHQFVMYCVDHNYGGIENLSLIPGTMGAAPMQNIGAYGVEVKEVINKVQAIDIQSGVVKEFSNSECKFGYRESIFKNEVKDKYFISSITLTLTKRNHQFKINYGAITDMLQHDLNNLSLKKVSEAVINIRRSKLPDPAVIGNAGSFFKNPSVHTSTYEAIRKNYPSVPSFPGENGLIKIPAAWLIEQCGWKGKTFDNIGVHKLQALVLVNYGGGDGGKIWELAMEIQRSVSEKFNIILHPEVNVM